MRLVLTGLAPRSQVCNYSRKVLGQTGDGHFSPVAAWDRETDSVLIMDVARFKYPPHWVPASLLYEAMLPYDASTSRPRGWLLIARPPHHRGSAVGLVASLLLTTPAGNRATSVWTSFAKHVSLSRSRGMGAGFLQGVLAGGSGCVGGVGVATGACVAAELCKGAVAVSPQPKRARSTRNQNVQDLRGTKTCKT